MLERFPVETQTLYAEFLDQLVALHAQRTIGLAPGCFTTKTVKGEPYYYFQYSDPGGVSRQAYVGKKSAALDKIVAAYQRDREVRAPGIERLYRISAQLKAGKALATEPASSRVLKAFAEAGVFHLGGVLVGTHAFLVYGNMLGVRWSGAFVRTSDIDLAGDARVDIALPNVGVDLPQVLENLQMGFLPIPPLNPKQPSTSFTIRGQSVRVDFLTPAYGSRREGAVFIDRFRVAAQRLPFLDYLLKGHVSAGVIDGGGILVNVPHPARYAFHKLVVSRSRDVTSQTKADKDIRQAMQLLEVLTEDRPGDVITAWEDLQQRGRGWIRPVQAALTAGAKRDKEILGKVLSLVPALKKT